MHLNKYSAPKNWDDLVLENNGNVFKKQPKVDVYETSDAVVLLIEMPNVKKENLSIQVEKGVLSIFGKSGQEIAEGNYLLRETRNTVYERHFELEDNMDTEQIRASYKLGILTIEIGKKESARPKKIQIN